MIFIDRPQYDAYWKVQSYVLNTKKETVVGYLVKYIISILWQESVLSPLLKNRTMQLTSVWLTVKTEAERSTCLPPPAIMLNHASSITTDVYVVDFIVKEDSQKNLHWTLTVIGLSTKNILSPTTELYLRFYWKLEKDWFFDCGKQFLNCKRKKRVSLTCLVRLSIGKIVLVCKLTDCRIVYHAIL